jgi:hypothetical protein
MSSEAAH